MRDKCGVGGVDRESYFGACVNPGGGTTVTVGTENRIKESHRVLAGTPARRNALRALSALHCSAPTTKLKAKRTENVAKMLENHMVKSYYCIDSVRRKGTD